MREAQKIGLCVQGEERDFILKIIGNDQRVSGREAK